MTWSMHVLDCVVIKLACPEVYQNATVKIKDAWEYTNIENVRDLAVVYQKAWRARLEVELVQTRTVT